MFPATHHKWRKQAIALKTPVAKVNACYRDLSSIDEETWRYNL
jgi:hypothetical protein